jgi:ATP-dependent exoDNAse (exonuclease V) alpha subunit
VLRFLRVVTQHYMLLQRNLIYTGIARGKKLVVLVGQKKALAIAGIMTDRRGGIRGCWRACGATDNKG